MINAMNMNNNNNAATALSTEATVSHKMWIKKLKVWAKPFGHCSSISIYINHWKLACKNKILFGLSGEWRSSDTDGWKCTKLQL